MNMDHNTNRRILLVDDHRPIHEDFRSILVPKAVATDTLDSLESSFFGEAVVTSKVLPDYQLDSAYQGQEALEKVDASLKRDQPYALAFMDVRMPPGWDGIQTIQRIWQVDPDIQVVVCTAYADYTWEEIYERFGDTENLVFLRKPFDHTEVRQLACAMTSKWRVGKLSRMKKAELEKMVQVKTEELADANRCLTDQNTQLNQKTTELEEALANVKTLKGLIPICASCKKIRDDKGFWNMVETYVCRHSDATFTHGICPDCMQKLFQECGINGQAQAK